MSNPVSELAGGSTRKQLPEPLQAPTQTLTIELGVEGMTCASCAARLERTLSKRRGVLGAEVQLVQERAKVRVLPGTSVESIFEAVEDAGFEPRNLPQQSLFDAAADDESRFATVARRDGLLLAISVALSVPLVLPMVAMSVGWHWHLPPWVEFALATPVQLLLGARFYRAGTRALLHGSGNMDLLVALGTSAAYGFSVFQLLQHPERPSLYFEAAAVVITLVRLGKWLEARAKRGTTAALRELLQLRPQKVVIRESSSKAGDTVSAFKEVEIGIESLRVGMIMVVRPGERLAADGFVIDGSAAIDESMLTGESLPVQRATGSEVVGGSLNLNGLLIVQASRVGPDATLGRIVQMVYGAQAGKAEVQQLVDRISALFVPIVLGIAAVTFVSWWVTGHDLEFAMLAAVSVLVIACPCALGLATPTAIVAGTGAAAKSGILVRDVNTLQEASQIDCLVFDKTGTLTEGHPAVVDVIAEPSSSATEVVLLAGSVERASTHPLSTAIVERAKIDELPLSMPEAFESHTGDGVSGIVSGRMIRVGRLDWLGRCGVATELAHLTPSTEDVRHAVVWVAADSKLLGRISIADRVRSTASQAIERLHTAGLRTVLLSGDDERVAAALGRELGMHESIGRAKPDDKLSLIARLRGEGRRVAMIGDGINDAPALAAADVGIAIGGGTEVAMQTANVVIMRPDLRLVAATLDIARATFRKIRQNLFWAFIYNCIGIPLAAAGQLSPMLAGFAMAMSSVSVVSNSLLLRRWRFKA